MNYRKLHSNDGGGAGSIDKVEVVLLGLGVSPLLLGNGGSGGSGGVVGGNPRGSGGRASPGRNLKMDCGSTSRASLCQSIQDLHVEMQSPPWQSYTSSKAPAFH